MANPADDTLDLETPVPAEGSKPWYESHAMWTSLITGVVGFLTILGVPETITSFIGTQFPVVIGAVMSLLSVYGVWANATRKTTLTTGR